jgi:hypothetical protein
VPEESLDDPTLSAVVTVLPAGERTTEAPVGALDLTEDLRAVGLAKARLTSAGFEVHAPMALSFSIGGKQSVFESVFGTKVVVDDSDLVRRVTTEDGGTDLPLDNLGDELRGLIKSVTFTPAPDFLGRS